MILKRPIVVNYGLNGRVTLSFLFVRTPLLTIRRVLGISRSVQGAAWRFLLKVIFAHPLGQLIPATRTSIPAPIPINPGRHLLAEVTTDTVDIHQLPRFFLTE